MFSSPGSLFRDPRTRDHQYARLGRCAPAMIRDGGIPPGRFYIPGFSLGVPPALRAGQPLVQSESHQPLSRWDSPIYQQLLILKRTLSFFLIHPVDLSCPAPVPLVLYVYTHKETYTVSRHYIRKFSVLRRSRQRAAELVVNPFK